MATTPLPPAALRRLLWLLAVAACLTVANLYYGQPLLATMAREFGASPRTIGLIPTATQLGYALGMLLLVPLGDSVERKKLIVIMTVAVAVALVGVALAPGLRALLAASFVLGATTVVPQLVVPFAAASVEDSVRGRSVGVVMSGLLVGVLLSRTVSGIVGAHLGWRVTYLAAAVLMVALAVLLQITLPRQQPPTREPWTRLLATLPGLVRGEPALRRHALMGACTFGAFSVFWTTLAFHLARPPLGYGSDTAGLFGLVGVVGALAAPIAGRLADRRGSAVVNLIAIGAVVVSYLVLGVFGAHLWGLALGVIALDFGAQANHVSNQTRVLGLSVALRNRMNTVYMVGYFAGGAMGSTLGAWAWNAWGWSGVCLAGGAFGAAALGVWALVARPHPSG